MAEIIPSVDPQVTVISASGSISNPRDHFVFPAIASRKSFAPQVIAYWFASSAIACIATRLISSGAAKSGKPCERLTAPCLMASRVISRMTDSVKRLALCETWRCFVGTVDVMRDGSLDRCKMKNVGKRAMMLSQRAGGWQPTLAFEASLRTAQVAASL